MKRPIPVPDELSEPFWKAVRNRRLEIQRCSHCERYYFPPVEFCTQCRSTKLSYTQVSGRGHVHHYTETRSGARQEYFEKSLPYLVGVVELDEQEGLYMYTNFPGSTLADMKIGKPVEVIFEDIDEEHTIPQFQIVAASSEQSHDK